MTEQGDKVKSLGFELKLMRCGGCNKWMGENQPYCIFCHWANDDLIGIADDFRPDTKEIKHRVKHSLTSQERKEINDRFESNTH